MTLPVPRLSRTIALLVGRRIRSLRRERKLSQYELAARVGTYRPVIARLETGRHEPSLEVLRPVARALRIDLQTLLEGIDWPRVDRLARLTVRGVYRARRSA